MRTQNQTTLIPRDAHVQFSVDYKARVFEGGSQLACNIIDHAVMPALTVFRHFTTKPFAGDDLQIVCLVLGAYRVIQAM